jgi:plasmid stabilization system protein ParE
MTNLEIHPLAQAEYDSAIDWYAEKSNAAAHRFVVEVEAAIEAIRKHPDSYARLDETHRCYLLNRFRTTSPIDKCEVQSRSWPFATRRKTKTLEGTIGAQVVHAPAGKVIRCGRIKSF